MRGQVFKIHSDFYYVNTEKGVIEAKIREILKKQDLHIYVGDYVALEQLNLEARQASICEVLPRKNFIQRPKAANIDQVVIVSSLKEPELDFEQLNRYLCISDYYKIHPVLCFNKNDLCLNDESTQKVVSIYQPLGYEIVFISALEKTGLDDIEKLLTRKISVLCGMSGVGKSTLINAINPDLNLKTNTVSKKNLKGTHTTRHCEIIKTELSDGTKCRIIDTPGFSNFKFDFLMPENITDLFPEIKTLATHCKYKNCLHLSEDGCNILANIDKINPSRYKSYLTFLKEAQEYKTKVLQQGTKTETKSKTINKKEVVKIGLKKRETGRKTVKQSLTKDIEANFDE